MRRGPIAQKSFAAILLASFAAAVLAGVLLSVARVGASSGVPRLVGRPVVGYDLSGSAHAATIGVAVRFARALSDPQDVGFYVAPTLTAGELIGRAFGGNPPDTVGRRGVHCYVAEALRPEPLSTVRRGARWLLGVANGNHRVGQVAHVTLRPAGPNWERGAVARLGCD